MSTREHALLEEALSNGMNPVALLTAAQALVAARAPTQNQGAATTLAEVCTAGFNAQDTMDPWVSETGTQAHEELPDGQRYQEFVQLGRGGMGEVRRVLDQHLGRTLARKTLHTSAQARPDLKARFLEEAQLTAQLQHPGIIPVHDLGTHPDGRVWFTMKEVSGNTLSEVIRDVHAASSGQWRSTPSGWSLRRLIDALGTVCDAVGYAHSRGVVHRDLKPDNIMVGAHGEVLVLDWGLAKVLDAPQEPAPSNTPKTIQTRRSIAGAYQTQEGQLAGTPAYMAPEQACGQVEQIDVRTDVYALGAILYEILKGRAPYIGHDAEEILAQVRSGVPAPLTAESGPHLPRLSPPTPAHESALGPACPPALLQACRRAMAHDPRHRFSSAGDFAAELLAWLDGARRRQDGLSVVEQAERKAPEALALRTRAATLRAEAAALLAGIQPWQPEQDKLPGWTLEDQADELEREAERVEFEEEQLLQASLTHEPALQEAHAALAVRYRRAHAAAEAARGETTRLERLMRQHVAALAEDHPDQPGHVAYLQGSGALTLLTDPPGAEVLLHRFELRNRRLVPTFLRSLGKTPIRTVPLPMGSYLCVLKHPDRMPVHYPVAIARGQHWDGVPPGGRDSVSISLPKSGELGPDEVYMPAGWFWSGGDPHSDRSLPARRVWADEFVIQRFSVTNRQYLAFLNHLAQAGRLEEALTHAPRERGATADSEGALLVELSGGRFSLSNDASHEADHPVAYINWKGAQAYADWVSQEQGCQWSLPTELVWEKAARGVDGRYFPWGNAFDPSWACMGLSDAHAEAGSARPVGSFVTDNSPYGVRDMAGTVSNWCRDRYTPLGLGPDSARASWQPPAEEEARRVFRGGGFYNSPAAVRCCWRAGVPPTGRFNTLGCRLVRPFRS